MFTALNFFFFVNFQCGFHHCFIVTIFFSFIDESIALSELSMMCNFGAKACRPSFYSSLAKRRSLVIE